MSQLIKPKVGDWVCVGYYIPPDHHLYHKGCNKIYYGQVAEADVIFNKFYYNVYGELDKNNVLTFKGAPGYAKECLFYHICDVNNGFRTDYQTYINKVKELS